MVFFLPIYFAEASGCSRHYLSFTVAGLTLYGTVKAIIFLEMPEKNTIVLLQTVARNMLFPVAQKTPKLTPCLEVQLILLSRSGSPDVRNYR